MKDLEKLTLRELVALYNKHSGEKPIRAFRDKATAVARVRAVLPTKRAAASATAAEMDVSPLADPITVDDLAKRLGTDARGARGFIDRARRLGHNVANCGRCTFVLK